MLKPCWLESGCRSGLGRVPPDSTPLRETQSLSFALSAVSGVSSQRGREAWGYLPTSEVTTLEGKLKLLGSNFSEKPPVPIGGRGPNGMAGGSKGTGQGWLGVTGILDCNAEFNGTVGGQHPGTPTIPRGRVALPRGREHQKVEGKAMGMGREGSARRKTSDPSQRGLHVPRRRFNAQAAQPTIGQPAVHADPAAGNCPRGPPL